jgi:hypothetical protein
MNIQGGAVSFEALWESGGIERGLKTTEQLVRNFTSLTVKGGADIDAEYQKVAANIDAGFKKIGSTINVNEAAIANLQKKYNDLGSAAAEAFAKGNDNKYNNLTQQQAVIQQEIGERKKVVAALTEQDAALVKLNKDLEDQKNKVDTASNSQVRFRTQLLNVKNEMMQLEQAGKKNTAEYARLVEEAKRLANAMYSANQQIKTLTSVKGATLQGFVSGLSGISGAFTAVNGAMGLFAGKNEELQKIMLRVQSLMSITMGLQAVSATLHQTSAFRLTVLTKAQAAYSAAVLATGKALIRFGLSANTARIAAQAFTATLTLGLGIAITAVITLISKWISNSNKAKEANKEIAKSISEQIASLTRLSARWKELGNNLAAQKKFLKENGDEIKKLTGKQLDLNQADELFVKNTGKFIEALILRARAEAKQKEILEKAEKAGKVEEKFDAEYERLKKIKGTVKNDRGEETIDEETGKPMLFQTSQKYFELEAQRAKLKKEMEAFIEEEIKLTEREKKKAYQDYFKWVNSGFAAEAQQQYAALLKGGKTYEEYLQKRRDKLLSEAEKARKKIGKKMTKTFPGNVDLLARPMIDAAELVKKGWEEAGEGIATVFSSQLGILDKDGKAVEILVTPILPDGSVLSPDELDDYIHQELEGAEDILKADNKGIVISVGVDRDGSAGKVLHELQEQYYLTQNLSGQQKELLKKLTGELAGEAGKTLTGEFEKSLQEQLSGAQTVIDKLKVIQDMRKELNAPDNNDPLKPQKQKTVDKASEEITKQADEDYKQAKKDYSDYLDSKIKADALYFKKRKELEDELKTTNDPKEQAILQKQIDTLDLNKKTEDLIDYDEMLNAYGTFEQKKQKIIEEYDAKRAIAQEQNNLEMIAKLDEAQAKAISSLASDELMGTKAWTNLFDNLDELTANEITTLINEIESNFDSLSEKFDPVDLDKIRDKLNDAKDVLIKDNPFKQLGTSIKAVLNNSGDNSKKTAKDIKRDWKNLAQATEGSFDFVIDAVNSADFLKDAIGEVGAAALGTMKSVAGSAIAVAAAIKTAETASVVLLVIQAVIAIVQGIMSILDAGAKKRQEQLKAEYEYYQALSETFDILIDKQKEFLSQKSGKTALDAYKDALDMVAAKQKAAKSGLEAFFQSGASSNHHSMGYRLNRDFGGLLNTQQALSMSAEEWEEWMRKNAELWTRLPQEVKDYAQSVIDARDQTEDLARAMQEAATGFSLDDAINQLSDLVTQSDLTFNKISESFYEHMKEAVMRLIQTKYIDKQLESWYKKFSDNMSDEDGLTDTEAQALQKEYQDIVNEANAAYEAAMKATGISLQDSMDATTLSGAIKGASQESIDLLAGQTNAVRVNQIESIEILRDSLIQLTLISANTGKSSKHLESIDSKISNNNTDPLRAQGIIDR